MESANRNGHLGTATGNGSTLGMLALLVFVWELLLISAARCPLDAQRSTPTVLRLTLARLRFKVVAQWDRCSNR